MIKALDKTMATIVSMKRHLNDDGTYSGLRITQAMSEATTQLTGARGLGRIAQRCRGNSLKDGYYCQVQ